MRLGLIIILLLTCFSFSSMRHAPSGNGDALFTQLPASKTNIRFNNKLKDTKDYNIMIYSNFYGGAGVAIGDINADGLQDIFFAGNQVGDQLYLNLGNMEFKEVTKSAGIEDNGGWSSGVIMGDVNGDGHLDIYVTRELFDDAPELRRNLLYINKGDGTFTEQAKAYGVDNDQRTRHATFLDYDKDGDLDLFLLNQPPNPGDYSKFYNTDLIIDEYRTRLYANEGDHFRDVTEQAGLGKTGFPNSVAAADLNGDGWTDLYVANDFWVNDWLFINNGDGTFTDKIYESVRHISYYSMGVDASDINNDGHLDVMVVDMVAEDNFRLKANMSGMNPEAFWKVVEDGGHYQYMFNMLHLNNGKGFFSDIAQLAGVAATDWSWSNLIADFDNDGHKDIYITNGLMRDIRNKDASKVFPKYLESELHKYLQKNPNPTESVGVWDVVDINKALELIPSEKLSNYAYKNLGDLRFEKVTKDWGLDQESFSNGSAYGDLDNDGDLDLVVNNINDLAFVYENQSADRKTGNYLRVQPDPDQKGITQLNCKVTIELDGAQQFIELSPVRGMYSTSEMVAHFGLGQTTMVDKVTVEWPDGRINTFTQVPANQQLTAAYSQAQKPVKKADALNTIFTEVPNALGLELKHTENQFDDFKTQVLMPQKMSGLGPALARGDVNGDGLEDLFLGGSVNIPAAIYKQTSNGSFSPCTNAVFEHHKKFEDLDAVFFDLENDGDLDLYVVSSGNEFIPGSPYYNDRLYLNDGAGNFTDGTHLIPEVGTAGSKVRPADFDQDGDIDLVVTGHHKPWAYPEPANTTLLVNVDGRLQDQTRQLAPELLQVGMINDARWTDLDQDGWQDLVIAGEWTPILIFMNREGKLQKTNNPGLEQSEGWWFSLASADMDGDGDQDLIAGNLGLNYKYQASKTEPFEVYYGDFDENGKKDVVLTYYNFGEKYPLRGRQCSSEQVPILKKKFETYNLFADADVEEVYGADKLDESLHLSAYTFASSYIENLGNGRFRMHPLPNMSQLSSVNAIQIDDYNLDNNLDILLAGNLYDAEVETTRNDAGYGMLLAGDGSGNFTSVPVMQSGFFVPYNVKSMLTIQQNGASILIVGCNNDALRYFGKRK